MLGLLLDWVWVRVVHVLVRVIAVIVSINVLVVGLVMGSRLNVLLLRLDVIYSVLKDACKVDQKNVVNINDSVRIIIRYVMYSIVRLMAYRLVSSCHISSSCCLIINVVIVGVSVVCWLVTETSLVIMVLGSCLLYTSPSPRD